MIGNSFEQWCNQIIKPFLSNNPPEEDQKILESCISAIVQDGELFVESINETDYFIDDFSPKFIYSILQMHVTDEDSKEINKYIQLYIPLFVKYLLKPEKKFVLLMKEVFINNKLHFYISTTKIFGDSPFYNENVKQIQCTDFISQAIKLFKARQITPKTYYWVVDIVLLFENPGKNDLIEFSTLANSLLLSYFMSDDDEIIKEIDIERNKDSFRLFKFNSTIFNDSNINSNKTNLTVLIKLAQCSDLKKQTDSIKTLIEISKSSNEDRDFIGRTSIFTDIIINGVSEELIKTFTEFMTIFVNDQLLPENVIVQFWEMCTNQPEEVSNSFMASFSDLYSVLPNNYLRYLVNYFTKANKFSPIGLDFIAKKCNKWDMEERITVLNNMLTIFEADDRCYEKAVIKLIPHNEEVCNETLDLCVNSIIKNENLDKALLLYRPSSLYASKKKIRDSFATIMGATGRVSALSHGLVESILVIISNFSSTFSEEEFEAFRGFAARLVSIDNEAAFDFFSKLEKKASQIFTKKMIRTMLVDACELKNFDSDLVKLIFRYLNHNSVDKNYYVEDPSTLKGLSILWNSLSKHLSNGICHFIADCFENDISSVVKRASKNINDAASIAILTRSIAITEDKYSCSLFGIKRNRLDSMVYISKITLVGDCKETIKVQTYITYEAFMEAICLVADLTGDSFKITRLNGEKLTEENFSLGPKETFRIKKNILGYSQYKAPNMESLPSYYLTQYSEALYDHIVNDKGILAAKSYFLLNELPTLPSVVKKLHEGNWEEILGTNNKILYLYYTNAIGNIALTDEAFTKQLAETGAAEMYLRDVVTDIYGVFKSKHSQEVVLDVACYILSHAEDKKKIIDNVGIDIIPDIIKLIAEKINNPSDDKVVDHLFILLNEIANIYYELIQKDETFLKLIPSLLFDKRPIIRNKTFNIVELFDTEVSRKFILQLMPEAAEKNNSSLFALANFIVEKSDDNEDIFNVLRDIIKTNYAPTTSDRTAILSFNFPPKELTKEIFKVLTTTVEKLKRADADLFEFILTKILFNPLKYSDPSAEIFNCIICMIKYDPPLVNKILPILAHYTFEEEDECDCKLRMADASGEAEKKKGLLNKGNTCYMNASLQQLFNVPEFRSSVLKPKVKKGWLKKLQELFYKMKFSTESYVNPKEFVQSWKWFGEPVNPTIQQDPVEFLEALIGDVNAELPGAGSVFKGKIKMETVGINVEYRSERKTEFKTLPLEVKGFETLESSFDDFIEPNLLEGENQYYDEKLGKFDAKMYPMLLHAPQVLILQLKRFVFNATTNNKEKITSKLTFPRVLDISKTMVGDRSAVYDLCGVIEHVGGVDSGHYVSYNGTGEDWNCYNDFSVTRFDPSTLSKLSQTACVLFYRKRPTKIVAGVEMNEDVFKTIIDDVKAKVRVEISENHNYVDFITNLCADNTNPAVSLACLPKQRTLKQETKESIKNAVIDNPLIVYNNVIMKDLLIVCNKREVRAFISEIVSTIIEVTKDTNIYMNFLRENIKLSAKFYRNFDEFLRPLETAIKHGVTIHDVIDILKLFFDEVRVRTSSGHRGIFKECDCSILFRLIRENFSDEIKDFISDFIKMDHVRKMRKISLELTKLRTIIFKDMSIEDLKNKLETAEYDEAADVFMVMINLGEFEEIEVIMERDARFLAGFLRELANQSNSMLIKLLSTETWWIKYFVIQKNSYICNNMIQVVQRAFESSNVNDGEETVALEPEQKKSLAKISETLFDFLQEAIKMDENPLNSYERNYTIEKPFVSILKWSIIRSENFKVIVDHYDTILETIQNLGDLDYDATSKILDILDLVIAIIKPNFVIPFFETEKKFVKMCDTINNAVPYSRNDSVPYITRFIIKTENKELSHYIYKSDLCKQLINGLRSTFPCSNELSNFFIRNLCPELSEHLIKILVDFDSINIFADDKHLSIAHLITEILVKQPKLANKFINSEVLSEIVRRLKKEECPSGLSILSSLLFATKGSNHALLTMLNNAMPSIKLNFDSKESWKFIEAVLFIGEEYAAVVLDKLPAHFFDGKNDAAKLSFFRTAAALYKNNAVIKAKLVDALNDSIVDDDGEVYDAWCEVVANVLDENCGELFAYAIQFIDDATETSFGNGLVRLAKTAEKNGFDIEPICERCNMLLYELVETDPLTKLHNLLEFALNFPRIREDINKLPQKQIDLFRKMCVDKSTNAIDCEKLLSIIIKKKN